MPDDILFCGNCKFLSPTEREQTSEEEEHQCRKYNKRVLHQGFHPHIVRLPECDEPKHDSDFLVIRMAPDDMDPNPPPKVIDGKLLCPLCLLLLDEDGYCWGCGYQAPEPPKVIA